MNDAAGEHQTVTVHIQHTTTPPLFRQEQTFWIVTGRKHTWRDLTCKTFPHD